MKSIVIVGFPSVLSPTFSHLSISNSIIQSRFWNKVRSPKNYFWFSADQQSEQQQQRRRRRHRVQTRPIGLIGVCPSRTTKIPSGCWLSSRIQRMNNQYDLISIQIFSGSKTPSQVATIGEDSPDHNQLHESLVSSDGIPTKRNLVCCCEG
jgi:hypothetical protein